MLLLSIECIIVLIDNSVSITFAKVQLKQSTSKFFDKKISFKPYLCKDLIAELGRNHGQLARKVCLSNDSLRKAFSCILKRLQYPLCNPKKQLRPHGYIRLIP